VYTGDGIEHSAAGDDRGVSLVMSIGTPSTVQYVKLSCTAKLVPAGFAGAERLYRERFIAGDCNDAGTWRVLKVSSTELRVHWSAPGDEYTIGADLTR
jgi:hypothetical protein